MSFVFFLLGFYSLLSQVILFREMAVVFQGHEIALGISLAAWLLWSGMGSASTKKPAVPDPRRALSLILSYLGVVVPSTDILIRLSKLLLAQGTIPSFASSLIWPFILLSAPCWLIGRAFRAGVLIQKEKGGWIYFMESLGAVMGGVVSIFILVGRAPSLITLSIFGGLVSVAGWWMRKFEFRPLPLIPIALNILLSVFVPKIDLWTRRVQWNQYEVIAQKETRYDHLLLAGHKNSSVLFQNGVIIAQNPDPAGQEELVHWPLLAHPHPKRVLAIGLPTVFSLNEIKKHRVESVYILEPDKQAIGFLEKFQTMNSRLREEIAKAVIPQDPRQWIKTHPKEYDVIIQSLPDPTNAALNRFFTAEFFKEARAALKEGGILAFSVSSSENYLPPDIALENMSVLKAVKSSFPYVELIPGSKMRVLASEKKIDLDLKLLSNRFKSRRIKNQVLTPETIPFYLDPARRNYVWMKASQSGEVALNTDLRPISYALAWKVWFSKFSSPWFSVGPLIILFVLGWTLRKLWALHRQRREFAEQNLLFLIGFGGMVMEMTGLLLFQSLSGALYWQLGLLSSAFMLGLMAGSGLTNKLKIRQHILGLVGVTDAMGIFAFLLAFNIEKLYVLPNIHFTWVFILFLFIPGFLVGAAFPLSATGLASEVIAQLYAADLWGSALGAFLASAFFIPVLGYNRLLIFTGIILILLPLLALRKNRKGNVIASANGTGGVIANPERSEG